MANVGVAPDTLFITFTGSVIRAADIQDGCELMGDDSCPRLATGIRRFHGDLYTICQDNGDNYTVAENQIISIVSKDRICRISAKDMATSGKSFYGHKVPIWYDESGLLDIDAYEYGWRLAIYDPLLTADTGTRLQFLAGIIDRIGGWDGKQFVLPKSEKIIRLVRSLGFRANVGIYDMGIMGALHFIPSKSYIFENDMPTDNLLSRISAKRAGRGEIIDLGTCGNLVMGDCTVLGDIFRSTNQPP